MTNRPKVSIIIPTYNRAHYISDAIESCLRQTFQDFEIIIVDDGSTDNTCDIVKQYSDRMRYFHKENAGVSSARNFGIEHSTGKYLAFLDSDDMLEPQMLEIQVNLLDSDPSLGLVYSKAYSFNFERPDICVPKSILQIPSPDDFPRAFFLNADVPINTVLMRRQCIQDVGAFDESLSNHEDGDLILRISLKWKVGFSDCFLAKCRYHFSNKSQNRTRIFECFIKSWEKILKENPDFRLWLGKDTYRKMGDLYYHLAINYRKGHQFENAKRAYIKSSQLRKQADIKTGLYDFILSHKNAPMHLIFSLNNYLDSIIFFIKRLVWFINRKIFVSAQK